MRTVRFDGRGRLLAYGHELWSGESVEMTNEEAARLEADPHISVTVTKTTRSQDPTPLAGEPEAHEGEGQPTNIETKE